MDDHHFGYKPKKHSFKINKSINYQIPSRRSKGTYLLIPKHLSKYLPKRLISLQVVGIVLFLVMIMMESTLLECMNFLFQNQRVHEEKAYLGVQKHPKPAQSEKIRCCWVGAFLHSYHHNGICPFIDHITNLVSKNKQTNK